MLIMIAVVFFSIYLMFNGAMSSGFVSPVTWFYGEEGSYSYRPEFLNAVFIGGGFFLISILYYFTQIRYRTLGVMLSLLFPLVIYAKRAEELPEIMITIMISLYIAVMVHNRRIDPAKDNSSRGVLVTNIPYIISMAIFVSVTGAVTMMIEKPTYFSKLERDSTYFDYYQTSGTGSGDMEDLSTESSTRRGGQQSSNDPVFYFETNGDQSEYFLRRQVFDPAAEDPAVVLRAPHIPRPGGSAHEGSRDMQGEGPRLEIPLRPHRRAIFLQRAFHGLEILVEKEEFSALFHSTPSPQIP